MKSDSKRMFAIAFFVQRYFTKKGIIVMKSYVVTFLTLISVIGFICDTHADNSSSTNRVETSLKVKAGKTNATPKNAQAAVFNSFKNRQAQKKPEKNKALEVFDSLKDDDIFLRIGDSEILTWKKIKEQVDLRYNVNVSPPPGLEITQQEIDDTRKFLFIKYVNNILRDYMLLAAVAYEARKLGYTVSDEEYSNFKTKSIAKYKKMKSAVKARKLISLIDEPASYFSQNATNMILSRKYFENIVKPSVNVSDEQIETVIKIRDDYNASVAPSNALIKAQMVDICADIRTNKTDFVEAAELYSEDGADKGYFGSFAPGEGIPEFEVVYTKMNPGEISDVVETPESFHILKLLKKNYIDGDSAKGEIESYEIAHIMIAKYEKKPVFTKESAREDLVSKLGMSKFKKFQYEQLRKVPIFCKVPLTSAKKPNKQKK